MPFHMSALRKENIAISLVTIFLLCASCGSSQHKAPVMTDYDLIECGAERMEQYLPLLSGKRIGIIANQTSVVNERHLVDTLLSKGIQVAKIFSPEHGFRGDHSDGATIQDGVDLKTGLPVISLYGRKKKPSGSDLENIDMIVYDIQDVGVRFYTFISTMALAMEACAESGIPFIVLDRPNPNGFYVDGPILDTAYRSFVGMHQVPIVYGMTPGEYAMMANGEGWLSGKLHCDLQVIPLKNYSREMTFKLPIDPSPNLPDWASVYLYPSLALFEGTIISVGRGTDVPFQVIGHPDFMFGSYVFTPRSIPGKSEHPPYEGEPCYGQSMKGTAENFRSNNDHLHLWPLLAMYEYFKDKGQFFKPYFDKLAGGDSLRMMIEKGASEENIRKSWEHGLAEFHKVREKYLLY